MSEVLATLNGAHAAVWAFFAQEAASGGVAALATARPDGGGGAVRMVVLRGADVEAGHLEFWTNQASEKVREMSRLDAGEVLFWRADDALQIRASVTFSVRQGDASHWATLGDGSRLNYARSPLPGNEIAAPDSLSLQPDPQLFAIVTAQIGSIDVLSLAHRPHRRAVIDAAGAARWVAP